MITQISHTYIFSKENGKEERQQVSKETLAFLVEKFSKDYEFYTRMVVEVEEQLQVQQKKINELKAKERYLTNIIEVNKNDPIFKRELADECFELKNTQEKFLKQCFILNGINSVLADALWERENSRRLYIEAKLYIKRLG